jgi:hypothetical protein
MITEEKINSNYILWIERLKKYNCYSDEMINEIGDKIKLASFSLGTTTGSAYCGSMIDTVLNHLCTIAYHINEDAFGLNAKQKDKHPFLKVNSDSLMRVLLLQHISKAELFVPQSEQWKINKGYPFEFNGELLSSLKTGERSIFLCQKYDVKLKEDEYEAMRIIDKEEDFKNNSYANPLSTIVRIANQFVAIETYRKSVVKNIQKETIEI